MKKILLATLLVAAGAAVVGTQYVMANNKAEQPQAGAAMTGESMAPADEDATTPDYGALEQENKDMDATMDHIDGDQPSGDEMPADEGSMDDGHTDGSHQ